MKKVVVITGGTDGLGKEVAKVLSSKHKVVILSPTEEKLKKVSKNLDCGYQVCDITKWKEVESAAGRIIKENKRIDCLVNNAAVWIQGELDDNSPEEVRQVMDVNLTGQLLMTKAIIPQMKKQKDGLIIFINSQAGFYAKAERSVYNAAKWGMTGFTKSLQPELAKYGIGVTGIYPGKMDTKMFEKMGIEKDMSNAIDPSDVAKTVGFVINQPNKVLIPELGIKHLEG